MMGGGYGDGGKNAGDGEKAIISGDGEKAIISGVGETTMSQGERKGDGETLLVMMEPVEVEVVRKEGGL